MREHTQRDGENDLKVVLLTMEVNVAQQPESRRLGHSLGDIVAAGLQFDKSEPVGSRRLRLTRQIVLHEALLHGLDHLTDPQEAVAISCTEVLEALQRLARSRILTEVGAIIDGKTVDLCNEIEERLVAIVLRETRLDLAVRVVEDVAFACRTCLLQSPIFLQAYLRLVQSGRRGRAIDTPAQLVDRAEMVEEGLESIFQLGLYVPILCDNERRGLFFKLAGRSECNGDNRLPLLVYQETSEAV